MILNKKVCIVVFLKSNNKRLPGKNKFNFFGKKIYQHTFDKLAKLNKNFDILIDSSDSEYLEYAKKLNFNTNLRSIKLNTQKTTGIDLINSVIDKIDNDIIVQLFVTTPLIKTKTIKKVVDFLINNKNYHSITPVFEVFNRFWHNSKPINHDFSKLKNTQHMKPIMGEAGFYVFKKNQFKKQNTRILKKNYLYKVNPLECIDIDTMIDFDLAKVVYKSDEYKKI